MQRTGNTFVSVVAPLHNDGAILDPFISEVMAQLDRHYQNYELVLVDDWSTDSTVAVAQQLMQVYAGIRLIRLSRHFGCEVAVIAGLESSIGDVVVVLRPDSDPPAEIARVVALTSASDVVQGVAVNAPVGGLWLRLFRAAFFLMCKRLLRLRVPRASTSFCGFTRRALNALTRIKQKQPYLSLLCGSVGYAQIRFKYRKVFRAAPPRHRSLLEAADLGISLLVANSISPLRVISYIGGFAGLLNLLYVGYILAVNLVKKKVAEGWTTLSLQTAVMFIFVFLILALMAEYISRILEETKDKPLYHVLEEMGGTTVVDPAMRNVLEYSVAVDERRHRLESEGHYAA